MLFLHTIFFNQKNQQLRSGWQIIIFILLMQVIAIPFFGLATGLSILVYGKPFYTLLNELPRESINRSIGLGSALLASWICVRYLAHSSLDSLGINLHTGWWRDLLIGLIAGFVMVSLIALMQLLGHGTNFHWQPPPLKAGIIIFIFIAVVVFIAASMEEVMFRGFPLQILARNTNMVVAALTLSLLFGMVHFGNPNRTFFSTLNTIFAGLWLSAAFFKTRSLWLAIGLHTSWNFVLGAIYGLPVSGIDWFSQNPLLTSVDRGPNWFTGGSYGPEGGLSATIVLALGTAWLIKTSWLKPSQEDWLKPSQEKEENHKEIEVTKDSL